MEEFLEEMEKEVNPAHIIDETSINNGNMTNTATVSYNNHRLPAGAAPLQNGRLGPHAGEFWFPECRLCECCKGFKFGCTICPNKICGRPGCPEIAGSGDACRQVANESRGQGNTSTIISNNGYNVNAPSNEGNSNTTICSYYIQGQCRFGSYCRFYHPSQESLNVPTATTDYSTMGNGSNGNYYTNNTGNNNNNEIYFCP